MIYFTLEEEARFEGLRKRGNCYVGIRIVDLLLLTEEESLIEEKKLPTIGDKVFIRGKVWQKYSYHMLYYSFVIYI